MSQPYRGEREMPRYRSHKIIHALKLENVRQIPGRHTTVFKPADTQYAEIHALDDEEVVKRCRALVTGDPGYYVVYPDGFRSWSPTQAFEDGYSEVEA